jgi:hypothetical protein
MDERVFSPFSVGDAQVVDGGGKSHPWADSRRGNSHVCKPRLGLLAGTGGSKCSRHAHGLRIIFL